MGQFSGRFRALWRYRVHALVVLVAALGLSTITRLWLDTHRIEATLTVSMLQRERDFSVYLLDLIRLEEAVKQYEVAPNETSRMNVEFAHALAQIRHRDNAALYGERLPASMESIHTDVAALLERIAALFDDAAPTLEAIRPIGQQLAALRLRVRQLSDKIYQDAIEASVSQRDQLDALRLSTLAIVSVMVLFGFALGMLLIRQHRQVQLLRTRSRALRIAEKSRTQLLGRLETLTENVPGAFFQLEIEHDGACRFTYVSAGITPISGLKAEQLIDDAGSFFARLAEHDRRSLLESLASDPRTLQSEVAFSRNGDRIWLGIEATPQSDRIDGRLAWNGFIHDITRRHSAEARSAHLAYYDPLTELPNRRHLLEALERALESSRREPHGGALMFIDLDNFKNINDTEGHAVGDELLKEVARRLRTTLRAGDTVARLGGDEFIVMVSGLDDETEQASIVVERIANKLLQALGEPYLLKGRVFHSTPSIGIALLDVGIHDKDELLKRADMAMYRAKEAGRNTVRFFDPEVQARLAERSKIEEEMRRALGGSEFLLHYQPQFDASGAMTGVEALVRWAHPSRGMVSPADFIPVAESSGLILPLGHFVLERACEEIAEWNRRVPAAPMDVAVNVSARQFRHAGFVLSVREVLIRSGLAPERLKIELTESLLLESIDDTVRNMDSLRKLGVRFSLDDFGTGYSSLAYLKELPIDQLKIDRSFVMDVLSDPNDAAIARTIIALGQTLGLHVLAEGVETADQRQFLVEHGCQSFQGFLYSRPIPLEVLYDRLEIEVVSSGAN